MQRRAALSVLSCATLTSLIGCDRGRDAQAPMRKIVIGLAIASHVHAVAWIAERRGMFRSRQLEADVQVMGGSAAAIRTLVAGQIDVALAGGDAVLKANWAGAELCVVAGLVDRFYHRIVARTAIRDGAGLHGKKLGLPFLGGPQDMAATYALKKLGLDRRDVELVVLGKDLNLIAALEKGEIDATTSELPKSRIARMGFSVLVDLPAEPAKFPYLVVAVRRDFLARDRAVVESVISALCQASAHYRDPAQRDASLAIVAEHVRSADAELSRELYREAGPSLLSSPPLPSRAAFETAIELAGKGEREKRQLERLIELGPLNAVRAQGACGA